MASPKRAGLNHLVGGLAEFERELIRARTGEGRERAVAKGVKMGRRPKLTDHQKREAVKRRDHSEETLAEIGRSYNVSGWTVARLRHDRRASSPRRSCAQRDVQPELFGGVLLVKEWGRIGAHGRMVAEPYDSEDFAAVALQRHAARKRRRGYTT
jgi:hypothetical protein